MTPALYILAGVVLGFIVLLLVDIIRDYPGPEEPPTPSLTGDPGSEGHCNAKKGHSSHE